MPAWAGGRGRARWWHGCHRALPRHQPAAPLHPRPDGGGALPALFALGRRPCPPRRHPAPRAPAQEGLRRGVIVNQQISEHNAAALQAEGTPALSRLFDDLGALQLHTAADEGGADGGPG